MESLRTNIKNIQNNNNLSSDEKNKEIQKLMNNSSKPISIKKCIHYPNKKCNNFYFLCCNIFTNCIRCHNELTENNHLPILKCITCKECKLLQYPSNECKNNNCKILFSKNYCNTCFIWTDKDIVHCSECGICRIGNKDTLFHCNNCETCFNDKLLHKCINKSYKEQICTYCMEHIHNAQDTSLSLRCEHIVHNKCLNNAMKSMCYTCPTCRKSIYDVDWTSLKYLINIQPMINEIYVGDIVKCIVFGNLLFKINSIENNLYSGVFVNTNIKGTFNIESLYKDPKRVDIYCNDCNKISNTIYHYLGHECEYCNSYNTTIK